MSKLVSRSGVGAALSAAQHDSNLDTLSGINESQVGLTYTVESTDQKRTIEISNAAAVAVTLDDIATIVAAIDTSDFIVTIKNAGAGAVTISSSGTDAFDNGDTSRVLVQYDCITLQTDSSGGKWNVISGLGGALLNLVYPVGAIYMSTANASPQTLFGGTWTSVQTGRVLLSEDGGANYTAGDTGGSKDAVNVSHTHADNFSIANNGDHTHTIATQKSAGTGGSALWASGVAGTPYNTGTDGDHTHTLNGAVTAAGVSGTDANMPPYLAVYMWERTA